MLMLWLNLLLSYSSSRLALKFHYSFPQNRAGIEKLAPLVVIWLPSRDFCQVTAVVTVKVGIELTKELFTSAEGCVYIKLRPSSYMGAPARLMRVTFPPDTTKSFTDCILNCWAKYMYTFEASGFTTSSANDFRNSNWVRYYFDWTLKPHRAEFFLSGNENGIHRSAANKLYSTMFLDKTIRQVYRLSISLGFYNYLAVYLSNRPWCCASIGTISHLAHCWVEFHSRVRLTWWHCTVQVLTYST